MQYTLLLATLCLPQTPTGESTQEAPPLELPAVDGMDEAVAALLDTRVQAARRAPENARAHAELGLALEANLMHAHARDAYARAVQLAPQDTLLSYRLGVLESVTGDPVAALETLRRVAREREDLLVVHARLAAVAFDLGELEESERHWQRAITLEDELRYPSSRVCLAAVWLELDRAPEALALIEHALAMDPSYRHGYFVLGQALLALERFDEAEVALRRGEDSQPSFPPGPHRAAIAALAVGKTGRMNLADDLLEAGRAEDAVAVLTELVEREPSDPLLRIRLARAYHAAGRLDVALSLLQKSAAEHPDHPELLLSLAQTALAARGQVTEVELLSGLYDLALHAADRACELAPNHGPARFVRATVRSRALPAADPRAVLDDLLAARRLGCRETGLAERIARSYATLGEVAQALHYAELSARENAFDPDAHLFLAHARVLANDVAGARAAWERAHALAPDHAAVRELGRTIAEIER